MSLTAAVFAVCTQAHALQVRDALALALDGTHASAVVLDPRTGAVLASTGPPRRGTPGSTIKPLLLAYALDHDIVRADMQVYCRRNLHVGGRALPCTHPADQPVFTAQRALAESCNTWFAEMARRFTSAQLEAALEDVHLRHAPMDNADVERRQLAVLGLAGVTTSPLELAQAYRAVLERMPPDGPVVRGLADSVSYGMADQAQVAGKMILGKTGTASDPDQAWTHGWFAGAIPGRVLIVVYVPNGDGGTAALLAQRFFRAISSSRQEP